MRILVAPQAFKGSLSAADVARAMAAGSGSEHHCELLPVADGGEGTVDALLAALGGEKRTAVVDDPLGRAIEARWALLPDGRAAIEMAAASGLPQYPHSLNFGGFSSPQRGHLTMASV